MSLSSVFSRYPATIWIRVIGTVLTKICDFMIRAFVGIYLYEKMGQDVLTSASVTVAGPAIGLLVNSVTGGWSDRYGRKPVMVASVLAQAVVVLGYIFASSFPHFLGLSLCAGLAHALYWPAASAQIADLVESEKRGEVFALMHASINVGAAIGPLIGITLYRSHPMAAFLASAAGLSIYALVLALFTVESAPGKVKGKSGAVAEAGADLRAADVGTVSDTDTAAAQARLPLLGFLRQHKTIFFITLSSIPVGLLYSQVELILPLHMRSRFEDYLKMYATLMTINGACVTVLQLPIQRRIQKLNLARSILGAYVALALTAVGYGWSPVFALLIFSELLFTLGEMVGGPQIQRVVAQIAPPELRGRYFAIHAMSWGASGVIGPLLGAFVFKQLNGSIWFSMVAGMLLIAGYAQYSITRRALT